MSIRTEDSNFFKISGKFGPLVSELVSLGERRWSGLMKQHIFSCWAYGSAWQNFGIFETIMPWPARTAATLTSYWWCSAQRSVGNRINHMWPFWGYLSVEDLATGRVIQLYGVLYWPLYGETCDGPILVSWVDVGVEGRGTCIEWLGDSRFCHLLPSAASVLGTVVWTTVGPPRLHCTCPNWSQTQLEAAGLPLDGSLAVHTGTRTDHLNSPGLLYSPRICYVTSVDGAEWNWDCETRKMIWNIKFVDHVNHADRRQYDH